MRVVFGKAIDTSMLSKDELANLAANIRSEIVLNIKDYGSN